MTTSVTAPVTPERIMQFAWGYVPPLILEAAIRHRIFDLWIAAQRQYEKSRRRQAPQNED